MFFGTIHPTPNFSVEWSLTFMTLIFCVEQFSHPSLSCVVLLMGSCRSPLRCPRTRVPRTEKADQWRVVSTQPQEGEVCPGGAYWSPLGSCLSAHTPNAPSAPRFHFIPGLWFSGSCLWITTGNSSCEFWLRTHSLSQFLHSCLLQAPSRGSSCHWPTQGLHSGQAPWHRTGFLWASFSWDVI